ncbi:MAG: Asp-tRNA(Asn)/Glu-tRNA(Gln) amidotransferase subunit GatC [bacterium]|nr:Asp-tRNA(Asn)/Glu-tRNA(Gln) amidotransferase subunit GatC [bacterium]
MSLTMKDLEQVLSLANLDVEPHEKEIYLDQLTNILEQMETLGKLDLEGVKPSAYACEHSTFLREDIVKQSAVSLEKNAPEWELNSFRVPKILAD